MVVALLLSLTLTLERWDKGLVLLGRDSKPLFLLLDVPLPLDDEFLGAAKGVGADGFVMPLWWSEWEKEEGKVDLRPAREALDRLRREGFFVMVLVNCATPKWFWEKHPWMPRTQFGPYPFESEWWKAYRRYLESVVRATRDFENVIGYGISLGGEADLVWAYPKESKACLRDFREWLKRRYQGDVRRLREAWGKDHLTFESVAFPERGEGEFEFSAAWRDWCDFRDSFWAWGAGRPARIVKALAPGRLVYVRLNAPFLTGSNLEGVPLG